VEAGKGCGGVSARHRVAQAITKLEQANADWEHQTWQDKQQAYFVFKSERSAQLMREALWLMFKSNRRTLIQQGRKP